jgi:cellulose synthase operon protein C
VGCSVRRASTGFENDNENEYDFLVRNLATAHGPLMLVVMLRRSRAVILVGLVTMMGGVLGAQPSVVPFMDGASAQEESGDLIRREGAARRAMELGFSSVAAGLWESLLAETNDADRRDELLLNWTITLLEDSRPSEASAALSQLSNPIATRAQLRAGLVAYAQDDLVTAEEQLEQVDVALLPANEQSWYHYLAGALAHEREDFTEARERFAAAIGAATSGLQRARFELADLRTSWRETEPTEAQAATLLRRMEEYAGEQVGFDAAKRYAAVLAALGRGPEAVTFLQNQLLNLPPAERVQRDDLRLLLGIIAGGQDGLGRNALYRLLAEGANRDKQRIALRMLANASPEAETRDELRGRLSQLLGAETRHPIEEDLILFRAELASTPGEATRDALALLERFPGSDLRTVALGILVSAAWQDERYRAAAGYAGQARRELGEFEASIRAQLGVLQADAFFRGGDYRSAADAYAAALDEPVAGVDPGDLVFQEVLSRIRDRQLTEAASRIDALMSDDRLDVINRWQAEWNLTRALQAEGRVDEAYARVNRIMTEDAPNEDLPLELAVRITWLQARLALEANEPAKALELVPPLMARLDVVPETLRLELASSLRLLEADAHFTLGQRDEALAVLQALRKAYPASDAAVYSFIEEAGVEANQGQLVKAQQLLAELIQEYPDNKYAPYALYQSALLAESRGEEDYLEEAINKIELLVTTYPDSKWVFPARFKQGDIYRKMGLWEPARSVYDKIIREFPNHRQIWSVQLALADSLSAQAGSNPALRESAAAIYERLRDVANASAELRIEAGSKAGSALVLSDRQSRGAELWWQVVDEFLIQDDAPENLGTKGRYWLARILMELGEVLEQQDKLIDARRAYDLMRSRGLPEAEWATEQLRRLGERGGEESAPVVDE